MADPITYVIIGLTAGVLLVNHALRRDLLYPATLLSAMWLATMVLALLSADIIYQASARVYLIVLTGLILFSIGSLVTSGRPQPAPTFNLRHNIVFWAIYIIPFAGLPIYLEQGVGLSREGIYTNILTNIRDVIANAGGTYGPSVYFSTFAYVAVALQLSGRKIDLKLLAPSLALALVYAVFSTGRTAIVILVFLVVGSLMIRRRLSPISGFAVLSLLVLFVFAVIGVVHSKGVSVDSTLTENAETLWADARLYATGGLTAFDALLDRVDTVDLGTHTFRSVLAFLRVVGLDVAVPSLVQEYTLIPAPFNVYTVYSPYVRDFSLVGAFLFQALFGLWHGHAYRRARDGSPTFTIAYAASLFPLLAQGFDDEYLTSLSLWAQFAILIGLYMYSVSPRVTTPVRDYATPGRAV